MYNKILLFFLLAITLSLSAQQVEILGLPLGNWNVQHYTIHDGLKQMQVNDVHVASDGKIWLATRAGLCTFNGESFDHFDDMEDKPSQAIGIEEYPDGTMIIDAGRYLYFYKSNAFDKVRVPDYFKPNYLSRMVVDWKGAIWLQWVNQAIIYYEGKFLSPAEYTEDDRFNDLHWFSMDHSDKEIYACTQHYIVKYKETRFDTIYTYENKSYEQNLPENKLFVNFKLDVCKKQRYYETTGINYIVATPEGEHFLYLDYRMEEVTQYGSGETTVDTFLMLDLPHAWALANWEQLIVNHDGRIVKLLDEINTDVYSISR